MPLRSVCLLAVAFAACALSCGTACGGNIGFMPGDAFFHTALREQLLTELDSDDRSLTLRYAQPAGTASLCGYAGFWRLRLQSVPPELVENLRRVYESLSRNEAKIVQVYRDEHGKTVRTELSGYHLFVYGRETIFSGQRIGLKYNEDWHDLPSAALRRNRKTPSVFTPPATVYQPFIRDYAAVVNDWQYAETFPPLRVRVPELEGWGILEKPILEPVRINAEDVQFVVLPYSEDLVGFWGKESILPDYFHQSRELEFLTVTASGVHAFRWDEGGRLHRTEWNDDADDAGEFRPGGLQPPVD